MRNGLLNDFEPHSAESWMEQLKKDLKGEPVEQLLWKTQGLSGKPFYTSEDIDFEPFNYSNFSKDSGLFGDRYWVNYQPLNGDDPAANNKALMALANGATGLCFSLKSIPDFNSLLKDIQPEYCHLAFELTESIDSSDFLDALHTYLDQSSIDAKKVSGYIYSGESLVNETSGIKSIGVSVENSGYAAPDLAVSLARMIEQIDQLTTEGKSLENCLSNTFFKLQISNDFFLEIARHRALRRLFKSVSSAYGQAKYNTEMISQAGPWTSSIDDPHSFMLHATTQVMAAIMGGTDAIAVLPFYEIFPNKQSLAERMARNISPILNEESYLGKVVDPAAGSYYIEQLTETLYRDALTLLQKIEAEGGISKTDVEQLKKDAQ
ncbi:methylmalonyl-CoA mutase family protein [Roseivirga sp.]|uniref:methylmalonyl-CoA mutase family protein n=1 Tax=Roseivirga sp. TaxID=1964215 RepID=UPI003B521DBC